MSGVFTRVLYFLQSLVVALHKLHQVLHSLFRKQIPGMMELKTSQGAIVSQSSRESAHTFISNVDESQADGLQRCVDLQGLTQGRTSIVTECGVRKVNTLETPVGS
jgi:hypothetical protein